MLLLERWQQRAYRISSWDELAARRRSIRAQRLNPCGYPNQGGKPEPVIGTWSGTELLFCFQTAETKPSDEVFLSCTTCSIAFKVKYLFLRARRRLAEQRLVPNVSISHAVGQTFERQSYLESREFNRRFFEMVSSWLSYFLPPLSQVTKTLFLLLWIVLTLSPCISADVCLHVSYL